MAVVSVSGERKTWHKITVDFETPETYQEAPSTFRDFRLDVAFTNTDTNEVVVVPGYFAADGDAEDTSASSGSVWRVNFTPPSEGNWTYSASFRTGTNIAANTNPNAGTPVSSINGETGSFTISPTDKTGDDFRAKGMILQDQGTHFLQYQGDGDYFIRGGPGIPENFLANPDIDGTSDGRHTFSSHAQDAEGNDPTWDGGRGQNILGAVNYLADQDQNTIYVLTNTAGGDGQDVWPWADADFGNLGKNKSSISNAASTTNGINASDFFVYDVSKLSQWEVIFDHMNAEGLYINLLLQETENDQLLNGGTDAPGPLSVERLVYMREMVARFGHLNGLQWNIGEENTNTDAERLAMADWLKEIDPYDHLVVVHTFGGQHELVYRPLLGDESFDGPSFQTGRNNIRQKTLQYIEESADAGDPWVISWDEDSGSGGQIAPFTNNPDSTNERGHREALWGHLTAKGSGVNWYFKNTQGHSLDQNFDEFRGYETVWEWTAAATSFFNQYIPFWNMEPSNNLTSRGDDFVYAQAGEYYVIYLPYGAATNVSLNLGGQSGEQFDVFWYNPRTGGNLIADGQVNGGGTVNLGNAPADAGKDWVVYVKNVNAPLRPVPDSSNTNVDPPQGSDDLVWLMEDGLVVMEAERGKFLFPDSNQNEWVETTAFDGYRGTSYLQWRGGDFFNNSNAGKEQTSPIEYKFTVDEPGTYHVSLRSIRPVTGEPSDRNNDFFIKLNDSPWYKIFFSGNRESWVYTSQIEVPEKRAPTYEITQADIDANNGVISFYVAGRSDFAGVDRIQIQKDSVNKNPNVPESSTVLESSLFVDEVIGSTGNDDLQGTSSADVMFGRNGNDLINGFGGDDNLFGENGNDTIYGGEGSDTIRGGDGHDLLIGDTSAGSGGGTATGTVVATTNSNADDTELGSNASSPDLETNLVIQVRLSVPGNSGNITQVSSAQLSFQSERAQSGSTTLTVRVRDSLDAEPFAAVGNSAFVTPAGGAQTAALNGSYSDNQQINNIIDLAPSINALIASQGPIGAGDTINIQITGSGATKYFAQGTGTLSLVATNGAVQANAAPIAPLAVEAPAVEDAEDAVATGVVSPEVLDALGLMGPVGGEGDGVLVY